MIEFYPQIKFVHILCVILSGSLFAARRLMMLADSPWTNHIVLRRLSWTIDTTLLVAALMLIMIMHQYPFVQAWLTVKVVMLVVYIVLGVFALKRGRTRAARLGFYVAALLVFLFIVSVARAHAPWGFLGEFIH
ncbi:MAG: SirB2 family protein [Xanthomonadales bacterium]|nr:SirB2 family protein [Xanthomonadales bacterium]